MKHTIEIEGNSKAGMGLLSIAKELAKRDRGISVSQEDLGDKKLLAKMLKGKRQGILSKEEKSTFIQELKELAANEI
ncbi:MAG: hypothetical protein ACKODM_05520 [Cytophagales bacterium]